jgi:defect-in-organelle-trafficking protein DotB
MSLIDEDDVPGAPESEDVFSRGHTGELFNIEGGGRFSQDVFDELLQWAVQRKVSDITVQSGEPVWAEIGGSYTRITRRQINHPEVADILRGTYAEPGPGMVTSGRSLEYPYEVRRNGVRMRFRVNATCGNFRGSRGFQISLRALPTKPLSVDEIGGVEQAILDNLRPFQGINLFAGPTGSGKSTLMAALIRWHCEKPGIAEKIIEYSNPVEYVYDECTFESSFVHQISPGDHLVPSDIDAESGAGIWSHAVYNALRRKPTIIIVGEARDKATIEAVIQGALTGHLIMSTMHTMGVPETIRRALVVFSASERRGVAVDLLESLNMVVNQLLLDRVGGGKVAVREFMIFDRNVRTALMALDPDEWPTRIRQMLSLHQVVGQSMSEDAERLLLKGVISPETFEWVANRTSNSSKIERQALSSEWLNDLN